jgi:RNA polymerase sigma factor (sigma-70 family)
MSNENNDRWRTRGSLLIQLQDPNDQAAWVEFYNRYRPMITGWCRRWFPRETEDMVQEVFLLLSKRLREFKYKPAKGRFRAYLKTITNRLMADLKEKPHPWQVDDERLLDEEEARRDLWERLATKYDLELLEVAKERVRDRVEQRTFQAYVAYAEQGRKPIDVARELDMKVGSVYQSRYSVLNELRQEIARLENSANS